MIVAHFDQGWRGLRAAEIQHAIVDAYCKPWATDDSRTVLVNNTWFYTDFDSAGNYVGNGRAFEQKINHWLESNHATHIVEYSLVDPAWNTPSYTVDLPVSRVGYYRNTPHWIDFHAIVASEHLWIDPALSTSAASITVPFMSLNGKPSPHRTELVTAIVEQDLQNQGIVSYSGPPKLTVDNHETYNAGILSGPNDSTTLGNIANWNSHLLNIVTETIWDVDNFAFWSEKTFKPMLGQRPFLIYTPDGAVDLLRKHGFVDFTDDWRDICDADLTVPSNIPTLLTALSNQSTAYLQDKYIKLQEKILHNHHQFSEHVKQQNALIAQR